MAVNKNIKQDNIKHNSKKTKTNIQKDTKSYKSLIITLGIILFLSLLIPFFPRIVLQGNQYLTINYNETYTDPGYNGYILNKNITDNMEVSNNIKYGIIGNYEINYYINLPGARVKKTRYIDVVDNVSPIINTEKTEIQICPNEEISEIKYEALDEYDGDVTENVKKIVNDNEILLEVEDSSKNNTKLTIKINREDKEPPKINLKGNSTVYVTYGNAYKEPGYTAQDNCSKDLTDKVIVKGKVERDIGVYNLTYEVTDESQNKGIATRKIIVSAPFYDKGTVNKGTIYLTFDDGPSQGTTNKILDVLKKENVKATFFVTTKGPDYLIKTMQEEGHTIALHTSTHNYSYIYSSTDNYFKDLKQVQDRVKNITGIESKIIRFPGGSSNAVSRNYKQGIMTELTTIVLSQGYHYFDWNVDGMDASTARNSKDVYYNVTSNLLFDRANIVLLHDIKNITADALEDIIKFGKEHGYNFSAIDMNTYMVRHKVIN